MRRPSVGVGTTWHSDAVSANAVHSADQGPVTKKVTLADEVLHQQFGGETLDEIIKNDLSLWREAFSVARARKDSIDNKNKGDLFTMADLCSGGCLDTLAAMRVGFKPI